MSTTALAMPSRRLPFVSVIIPAHSPSLELARALDALQASDAAEWECLVADDASADMSVSRVASERGAISIRLDRPSGPAAARNRGARGARGEVLLFIDSDVVVRRDTLSRLQQFFAGNPDVAAVFGSYDDSPSDQGLASQFKNLTHHFVHQQGRREASTFWAGCGAVRREVFLAAGGFDETYRRPCIEDIELGYRLRRRGARIVLLKELTVTHLKRWTVSGVLRSDLIDRGIPWVRLALCHRAGFVGDLNLAWKQRACVALAWTSIVLGAMSVRQPALALPAMLALLTVLALNAGFFGWLVRIRGWRFALRAAPLHLLYHLSNGLAVAIGVVAHLVSDPPTPRLLPQTQVPRE